MRNQMFQWKFFSSKTIAFFLMLLVIFLLGTVLFFQAKTVYDKVHNNWQEFVFVYDHPSLVKGERESFASDSAALETSYATHQKSPEQILLEQVTAQLKAAPSK